MSMMKEFKEFVLRGNVVDMAIGIIIGLAFGKIVSSLVADVIMPPIGVFLGGVNFSDLTIIIKEAVASEPAVVISYGKFLQTIIDFIIIAIVVFMGIKAMNSLNKRKDAASQAPTLPSPEEVLLAEIRDLLRKDR